MQAGRAFREGVDALGGYGEVFQRNVLASGVIPQISLIMGPCAGGDVYSPAMTDFIFMVRDRSYMFVTGPEVVKTVTNEEVTSEQLGGAYVHTTRSSIADGAYDDDVDALLQMRRLIDFLPAHNLASAPQLDNYDPWDREDLSLDTLIPMNPNQPYDMKELIVKTVDEGISSRFRRPSRRISSRALPALKGAASVLWPTSRWCWPVCSIVIVRVRRPVSCAFAMRSAFLSSPLLMCPASCPHRSGIWRSHQAWGQAALCLCRSDSAQGDGDHPQGLWWRL